MSVPRALTERAIEAATNGDVETLRETLKEGVSINSATSYGWTLLILAVRHGHPICVKFLLEEGAPVDYRAKEHTWTPLQFAGYNKRKECVEMLLEAGADGTLETRDQTASDLAREVNAGEIAQMIDDWISGSTLKPAKRN